LILTALVIDGNVDDDGDDLGEENNNDVQIGLSNVIDSAEDNNAERLSAGSEPGDFQRFYSERI
jgi:hypothetical protein